MRRSEPSRGEAAAWKQLRLLGGVGFAFRREHRIGAYCADFVCLRRRLIVEIDGGVHDFPGKAEHDAGRDVWLRAKGYTVLRFRDSEILSEANWLDGRPLRCDLDSNAPRASNGRGRGGSSSDGERA